MLQQVNQLPSGWWLHVSFTPHLHQPTPCVLAIVPAEKASSSDDEGDEKVGKGDDGAESGGVTGTDAAGQTPEPGTTPEPEDKDNKGDALAALLAAGGSYAHRTASPVHLVAAVNLSFVAESSQTGVVVVFWCSG